MTNDEPEDHTEWKENVLFLQKTKNFFKNPNSLNLLITIYVRTRLG